MPVKTEPCFVKGMTRDWRSQGLKSTVATASLVSADALTEMVNVWPAISGLGDTEIEFIDGLAQAAVPRPRPRVSEAARVRKRFGVRYGGVFVVSNKFLQVFIFFFRISSAKNARSTRYDSGASELFPDKGGTKVPLVVTPIRIH